MSFEQLLAWIPPGSPDEALAREIDFERLPSHVAMALEGLVRRDFSLRLKEKMLMAGFVVLITLMVTVIYNDLTRISWIERLMPWR